MRVAPPPDDDGGDDDARSAGGAELPRTHGFPGGSAMKRFSEDLFRDIGQLFDDHMAAASWAVGGIGEMYVARELEKLPRGWYITHDVKVGHGGANLDHVVVGPPGVFVLNTKYHGEKPVLVNRHVYVGSRRTRHVEQGEREAELATERLTGVFGSPVPAVSLVVVVGFQFRESQQPPSASVRVAHVKHMVRFLSGLAPQLPPSVVQQLTRHVRDLHTWFPSR